MLRFLGPVFVFLLAVVAGCAARTQSFPPPVSPQLTRTLELSCPTVEDGCTGESEWDFMVQVLYNLEVDGHVSLPSQELWVPYAQTEPYILADAARLWNTGMLESLWVEVRDDEPWANGVLAKRIIFNMVPREGDPVTPSGLPSLPPGFETPAPGHERLYP